MTDNVNSRALYAKATASDDMTETMCINFCSSQNYAYGTKILAQDLTQR